MGADRPDFWRVKILFCDVDGVLTDGGIYFGPQGQVFKRFNVKDGLGIRRLVRAGVKVVWVSGDDSEIVRARAAKLGVAEVYTGVEDKAGAVKAVLEREGLEPEAAAYIGDDINDLPAMGVVRLAIAVADAHPRVKAAASYVTRAGGGMGAVREICDLMLGEGE